MSVFSPADILLPKDADMSKWAVIACDQFTSQPEYWEEVKRTVGDAPSALNMILPEAELPASEERIAQIDAAMLECLDKGILEEHKNSYIYVERTLNNGSIRKGIVGMIDLNEYDYMPDAVTPIRATEKTVVERIPPRMAVRRGAAIELPHVLLLCDDEEKKIIEPLSVGRRALPLMYDFDLMQGGGHITGWLITGLARRALDMRIAAYEAKAREKAPDAPFMYAVGDGNHSLATAKACWLESGSDSARYALVELENIHDEAQEFEPIHRVIKNTDVKKLLETAQSVCAEGGMEIGWYAGEESGKLCLNKALGELPVGILQGFLDSYLAENAGEIDYIHGDDVLCRLSQSENTVGFMLPAMAKGDFFRGIAADGVLPRKTFSMGSANEKRYYLEAKKIK